MVRTSSKDRGEMVRHSSTERLLTRWKAKRWRPRRQQITSKKSLRPTPNRGPTLTMDRSAPEALPPSRKRKRALSREPSLGPLPLVVFNSPGGRTFRRVLKGAEQRLRSFGVNGK